MPYCSFCREKTRETPAGCTRNQSFTWKPPDFLTLLYCFWYDVDASAAIVKNEQPSNAGVHQETVIARLAAFLQPAVSWVDVSSTCARPRDPFKFCVRLREVFQNQISFHLHQPPTSFKRWHEEGRLQSAVTCYVTDHEARPSPPLREQRVKGYRQTMWAVCLSVCVCVFPTLPLWVWLFLGPCARSMQKPVVWQKRLSSWILRTAWTMSLLTTKWQKERERKRPTV